MTGLSSLCRTSAMNSFESYPVSPMSASPRAKSSSSTALIISWRCPGVSVMWIGRALVSTIAWSFVEKPPRERPRALRSIPLFRPPHPGVREQQSRLRSTRCRRPPIGGRGRWSPNGPWQPSWQSGCRPTSNDRIAPANLAKELQSWHETARRR